MFNTEEKITIISENFEAFYEALQKAKRPERCSLLVKRASSLAELDGHETAIIVDGDISILEEYRRDGGKAFTVLMDEAKGIDAVTEEQFENVEFGMVMPDGNRYNSKFMKVYLERILRLLKIKADRRRSDICITTLVESMPDMVWIKDLEGRHLVVNQAFCDVVGKDKENVIGQKHCAIWDVSEDAAETCAESDMRVIAERITLQFEEAVRKGDKLRLICSDKSSLVDDEGKVFGTCGVGHDVTGVKNIDKALNLVIESIPFGAVMLDENNQIINANQPVRVLFPGIGEPVGKDYDEWFDRLDYTLLKDRNGTLIYSIKQGMGARIIEKHQYPIQDVFGNESGKLIIFADITISYNFELQTLREAHTDYLTDLNNRRGLSKYFKNHEEYHHFTVAAFDLDHFKAINDNYGHYAGDQALIIFAELLRMHFPEEYIARIGGDEFMMVSCRDIPKEERLKEINFFMDDVTSTYDSFKHLKGVRTSVGVAEGTGINSSHRFDELMRRADGALYRAKENGRGRVEIAEPLIK